MKKLSKIIFIFLLILGVGTAQITYAAIAFDSKLNGTVTASGTSHTQAFTNTAGNMVIIGILVTNTTTTLSDVQYAGSAMTAVTGSPLNTGAGAGGNEQISMYWIVNAATGANNITYTTSATTQTIVAAVSYSGAATTGQPDASDTTISSGTTDLTLDMTTATNDAWLVGFWRNAYEAAVAGANTTFRTDAGSNTTPMGDRGPVTPAGAFNVIAHDDISRDWSGIGMAIKPAASAAAAPAPNSQEIIWFEES